MGLVIKRKWKEVVQQTGIQAFVVWNVFLSRVNVFVECQMCGLIELKSNL